MAGQQAWAWIALGGVAHFLAGVVAYGTRTSMLVAALVALVVALPGILELRVRGRREADQALSAILAAMTLLAVLILVPYLTAGQGTPIWQERSFHVVALAVVGASHLAWNERAARLRPDVLPPRTVQLAALTHLGLVAMACLLVAVGRDGTAWTTHVAGGASLRWDLTWAPLLVGLPGLLWGSFAWLVHRQDASTTPA